MSELSKLYEAILTGDSKAAVAITKEALAAGTDPLEIVNTQMVPAMDEAGRRFECEEYFVPELLLAARAMKGALELIRPLLAERGTEPAGRVVIGTVKGDLHDIGKNLVSSMLEGGGFEVIDLGADVAPERFVEAVRERNPDLVCLSALLTVTMPSMKTTIDALKDAGLRDRVRVLVGGAPVTEQWAREIGADGYGPNAAAAVPLARKLIMK
ncbi:MAG TPA: corrinoid protein [Bryobacteraceae bacterium]|nr:corrinoid protein [Bryobacteraceae bacterium]HOQ45760.1 corrinoid protein [Bryobacteraceae bacterium]HPQ13964.1 corrinoid protein [Bryobacteraceae bacterium]HPU71513.1 corrinoid protein [Bryobacteraceae bacterium]